MNQFIYHLIKSFISAISNKRALLFVLISSACFGIFITMGSIHFYSDISLLCSPLFIIGGALLYFIIWIFYSALLSFRSKLEPESFLVRDSITYLPSVLLLAYIISFFIKAESVYPGIVPPQEHLMKMLFLFIASLTLALIISLKIFVHGHFEEEISKTFKGFNTDAIGYALISALFFVVSTLVYLKFNALNHYGGDIAAYIQRIWFITQTGIPKSTIFSVPVGGEPIIPNIARWLPLYLSAPFMLIFQHPASILISQAFFIFIAAIPVYLIGRDVLKSRFLGCLLSLSFLFHPATQYLYLQGFHSDAFGVAFLAFALYFLYKQKYKPFLIASALMVMCKENFSLIGLFLGLYIMLHSSMLGLMHVVERRKIIYGSICVAFSALWAYVVFTVMPYEGGPKIFMPSYGYLGSSVSEVIHTIMTKPLFVLSHVFTLAKIAYLGMLLLPLILILPLFSGIFVLGLPIFAQNLLSAYYPHYSIMYQYSAILLPILYISAIESLSKIHNSNFTSRLNQIFEKLSGGHFDSRSRNLVISLIFLILLFTLASSTTYGPFGYIYKVNASEVSGHSTYFENMFTETQQYRIAKEIASQIPENASVIVQEPFQMLLSQREHIYIFHYHTFSEERVENVTPYRVEYVIVNLNNPRLENVDGWKKWMEGLEHRGWEKIMERDGFFVFKSKSTGR